MNKKTLITFYATLLILLTGCTTPKDTVENVFDALHEGDLAKLSRNSSERTTGIFSLNALDKCSPQIKKNKNKKDDISIINDCLAEEYADMRVQKVNLVSVSDSEVDVDMILFYNKKTLNYKFKVLKINGDWKVHLEGKNFTHKSPEISFTKK